MLTIRNSYFRKEGLYRAILMIALLFSTYTFVSAQKYSVETIRGYIRDGSSYEVLIGATVYLKGSPIAAVSNDYGYFTLSSTFTASDTIIFNYLGFQSEVLAITELILSNPLNIELIPNVQISDVIITSKLNHFKRSQYKSVENLASIPTVIQQDFFRSIHTLPGVQTGNEGQVAFNVRGGNGDHNLILINNAPLFNPSHGLGFFSALSPDVISSFQFMKDHFPVEFGGRSASVMNIKLKEGNLDSLKMSASVGLLSSDFQISGPIKKNRTSFFLGARRSYLDLLSKAVLLFSSNNFGIDPSVNFYDINFNISHKVNDLNKISYFGYHSKDNFRLDLGENSRTSKDNARWSNWVQSLGWNTILPRSIFLNTTLYTSRYNSTITDFQEFGFEREFQEYRHVNTVQNTGLKSVAEFAPNESNYFKAGFELIRHGYIPLNSSFKSSTEAFFTPITTSSTRFTEYNLFLGHKVQFKKGSLDYGVRYTYLAHLNYNSFQPRVNYLLRLLQFDISLSYDKMLQSSNTVSSSKIALPTDVIVPPTENFLPLTSDQFSLGIFRQVGKLNITINPFYKILNGVLNYKDGFSFIDPNTFDISVTSDWEDKVTQGKGTAKGVEVSAEGSISNTSVLLSYTFTDANRRYQDINQGNSFPFRFNRKHVFNINLEHKFSKNSSISIGWIFGSGQYTTFPQFLVPIAFFRFPYFELPEVGNTHNVYDYGKRNSVRMAPYHRLDMSYTRKLNFKNRDGKLSLGLYNAYARANPFEINAFYNQNIQSIDIEIVSLFRFIIPSISYKITIK